MYHHAIDLSISFCAFVGLDRETRRCWALPFLTSAAFSRNIEARCRSAVLADWHASIRRLQIICLPVAIAFTAQFSYFYCTAVAFARKQPKTLLVVPWSVCEVPLYYSVLDMMSSGLRPSDELLGASAGTYPLKKPPFGGFCVCHHCCVGKRSSLSDRCQIH